MTTKADRAALAALLRRAGIPATAKRLMELAGPFAYIGAAGARLTSAESATLSPIAPLWSDEP